MTEEEIRSQREKCSDCGGALQEIDVRYAGHATVPRLHIVSREMRKNIWSGEQIRYTEVGVLLAFMCSSCARVYFYGAEKPPRMIGVVEPWQSGETQSE